MTMPAVAPPLRPLFAALSACPPCDGGNTPAVVASIAEVSMFDEDDSLVVDDIVFVGSVSKQLHDVKRNQYILHTVLAISFRTPTHQCW